MKFTMKLLMLLFGIMILANVTYAESLNEQLNLMVEQLQKNPSDNALREKIIKLAQEVKPALPEEAERHMAYGMAASDDAKSIADYKEAAKEFEQATQAAPWYGDAYYKLGMMQDKSGNYDAALLSLRLAQLALPEVKEIKALIYQTEYRNKKAQATPKSNESFLKNTQAMPKSGESFSDCSDCPEMVVMPAGSAIFAIGKYEVTQGQWRAVMDNNPSYCPHCGDNCPVEKVSWDDAKDFIIRLNTKTGQQYRLPTEAEWEYACRAGGKQEYCGSDSVDSVAWYTGNSGDTTHPVGLKQSNAFGLYDMSGNVWEWVEDCQNVDCNTHVLRGGSWLNGAFSARASARYDHMPVVRVINYGLRLVRNK